MKCPLCGMPLCKKPLWISEDGKLKAYKCSRSRKSSGHRYNIFLIRED